MYADKYIQDFQRVLQIVKAGIPIVKKFRNRGSHPVVNVHASFRGLYIEVTTVRE